LRLCENAWSDTPPRQQSPKRNKGTLTVSFGFALQDVGSTIIERLTARAAASDEPAASRLRARERQRVLHVDQPTPAGVADANRRIIWLTMRVTIVLVAALSAGLALAKLPPPTDEARAKAAEAAAKSAWTDKVGAYKTCLAIERTAQRYRQSRSAGAQSVPVAANTPSCSDPGPFRPIEASGAHSPPETASQPPSTSPTPQAASK
jgi:hypothetical protein